MTSNIQRNIDNAQAESRVVQLRYLGKTFEEIAKELGYADRSGALRLFKRAMDKIEIETPNQVRAIELQRLDRITEMLMSRLETGELDVIVPILKVMDRRAKLLGLDMPIKIEQDVTTWEGGDSIDRAVKDLANLLRINAENSASASAMAGDTSPRESIATVGSMADMDDPDGSGLGQK